MDIKKLFTYNYQFTITTAVSRGDKLYAVLGGILILLAVVVKIASILAPNPVDKKYRGMFYAPLLTTGLWEVVWYGLRYEYINFFGSHFVAWLGLLIGLVWFAFVAIKTIHHYGMERTTWQKDQVRLKYLPK